MDEDSRTIRGRDAQRMIVDTAWNMAEAVRATLGPRGMDMMLVDRMGNQVLTNDGATILKASNLLAARKNMGKYGIKPTDVVYIVNQLQYHNLIADAAYADSSQVEGLATKLTGQVGQVYGSPVIVSDEFATPAVGKY